MLWLSEKVSDKKPQEQLKDRIHGQVPTCQYDTQLRSEGHDIMFSPHIVLLEGFSDPKGSQTRTVRLLLTLMKFVSQLYTGQFLLFD